MNTVEDVREYGRRIKLPELGVNALVGAWASPPVRRVQSTWRSVVARFTSLKMRKTIQGESHWVELAFIFLLEYAAEVLAYLDQPLKIKVAHLERSGKWSAHWYTPDFAVCYSDHAELVECKLETDLEATAREKPWLYVKTPDGIWSCPPAERAVEPYGFQFRVWTPPANCGVVVRNLRMLQDYLREDCPPVPDDIKGKVIRLVSEQPGITVADIFAKSDVWRIDHVYTLIARGELYFDLRNHVLAETDRAQLYIDEETATAFTCIRNELSASQVKTSSVVRLAIGASFVWKTRVFTVANFTENVVVLGSADGSVDFPRIEFEARARKGEITGLSEAVDIEMQTRARELVLQAGHQALAEAVRKKWLLDHPGSPQSKALSPRTRRYWNQLRRIGVTKYGCSLLGLIPNVRLRGNRAPKLDARVYALADQTIKDKFMTTTQRSRTAAYGFLRLECEKLGIIAPSFPWFIGRIGKVDQYELVNSRCGRRAAYKYSDQLHGQPNPNHGDRPWEVGLVDHTELDIETRCPMTLQNLGRPWLSTLQDGFSRRILAYVLMYDPPSYRTLMLLIRKCLRAHGRLPSSLVVDGGKEFGSAYFETLMARCECTLIRRPPAQSRYGSLVERVFGTSTTQLIHNLNGNTKASKLVRQMTAQVDPKRHATWPLSELDSAFDEYYRDHYDSRPHPGLDMMTPAAKYALGMEQSGAREHRIIAFTEDVYILTLPTTRSGHARVQAGQGIVVNRILYWADAMKDPEVEGQDVDIRFDPLDASIAYAHIKGRWYKCVSEHSAVFQGRTQKEIELASNIIRQRAVAARGAVTLSAKKLADFLASAEIDESLQKQRLKDVALKQTLGLGSAEVNLKGTTAPPQHLTTVQGGQSSMADPSPDDSVPVVTEVYQDC